MLLAIDIGNSSIKFGIFDNEKLVSRFAIPTGRVLSEPGVLATEFTATAAVGINIHAVIISSVVPEIEPACRKFSEKHLAVKPIFVDHTFDFGLKIKYDPPGSLGIDRLIAAFAAVGKYGVPCIVCDFGTAATIDAINSNGEYRGGIIAPGINNLSEALHRKIPRLPRVEIQKPESVFGNTTTGSIQSGIFFGYIGLVEGILKRMIDELTETPKIIATGGSAQLIAESCPMVEIVEADLILNGLCALSHL